MSTRLVLADDSVLFREGVARVLTELGFDVVGQAGDANQLLKLVEREEPDAAIVDIRMPPTRTDEGLRAAVEIGERQPNVGVLVLSHFVDPEYAMHLLRHGPPGRGYLLKDRIADFEAFSEAIETVADGGSVVDPDVVEPLVMKSGIQGPLGELTERELGILALMAQGRSNAGICEVLTLSPRTVESHVRVIMRKLGLEQGDDNHRRVLAVLAYLRANSLKR
jgi:DNA-binding NarL/FixJ family response regulator